MTEITKEEFLDWRSQNVTKVVFREIENMIGNLKEELSYQAGADPLSDKMKVGAITALRDILDIRIGGDE